MSHAAAHPPPSPVSAPARPARRGLALCLGLSLAGHGALLWLGEAPKPAAAIGNPPLNIALVGTPSAAPARTAMPAGTARGAGRQAQTASPARPSPTATPASPAGDLLEDAPPPAAPRHAGPAADDPAAPPSPAEINQLVGTLQSRLADHLHYPLLARRRGWQGEVRIALRIYPDGRLDDIRVVGSSGHALLDRAALEALAAVGRLPALLPHLGTSQDLILPVRYRLLDT